MIFRKALDAIIQSALLSFVITMIMWKVGFDWNTTVGTVVISVIVWNTIVFIGV